MIHHPSQSRLQVGLESSLEALNLLLFLVPKMLVMQVDLQLSILGYAASLTSHGKLLLNDPLHRGASLHPCSQDDPVESTGLL